MPRPSRHSASSRRCRSERHRFAVYALVAASAGGGKTTIAEDFKKKVGALRIVDDYDPDGERRPPLRAGDLVIMRERPRVCGDCCKVLSIEEAMQMLRND